MKKDPFARLTALLLFGIGYLLFSFMGMLPSSMSVPLPTHSRYVLLPVTGPDISEDLLAYSQKEKIPAQSFDRYIASNPSTAWLSSYQDGSTVHLLAENETYSRKGSARLKGDLSVDKKAPGLYVKIKGVTYSFFNREEPRISYGTTSVSLSHEAYSEKPRGYDPAVLAALLETQEKDKLTPSDFAALMHSKYNGQLVGWFPKTHIAYIKKVGEKVLFRFHTDTGIFEQRSFPEDTIFLGTRGDSAVIWRCEDGTKLMKTDFTTGEETVLGSGGDLDQRSVILPVYEEAEDTLYLLVATEPMDDGEVFVLCFRENLHERLHGKQVQDETKFALSSPSIYSFEKRVLYVFETKEGIFYISFDKEDWFKS